MLDVAIAATLRTLELRLELSVDRGRRLALVGPSGAGKSSVLRAIAGLLRPREGYVECCDETWLATDAGIDLPPERRRCGYVFQDYALFGHMSTWRNVAYGLDRLPRSRRRAAAVDLLDRFGIARLAEARPGTLSGGERQRVALARAVGSSPRALLLDEPLAALDASTRVGASRELHELTAAADVPTLLVTHDFVEASTLADEVAVIEDGQIVQRGDPDTLAAAPATAFVADLTGAIVLTGTAVPGPGGVVAVRLDGGGMATTTASAGRAGPVAISIRPWDIALEPVDAAPRGSPRNRLPATVSSVATIGDRVRVGLRAPQPLVAEVTPAARDELALSPGAEVVAVWKASATRMVPR